MNELPDTRRLLQHHEWIRALAHQLVSDPHLADDLAQDTWVSALRRPPASSGPVRGWLATVMRRHLSQRRRGNTRRAVREAATARDESVPGVDEVVARASVHRELVRHVLGMKEPYRTTVLLRYFEGLSYSEMARRQGTTPATVNSRLTRGLERLRGKLEREHQDDERTWAAWLTPLLYPDGSASSTASVGAPTLLAATALIGAGVVWTLGPPQEKGVTAPTTLPPTDSPLAATGASTTDVARPAGDPVAYREAMIAESPPTVDPGLTPTRRVRGIVLDGRGQPVAGVRLIRLEHPSERILEGEVVSDPSGHFDVESPPTGVHVAARDTHWVTVFTGWTASGADQVPAVIVVPPITYAGVVVDERGRPVEGAHLRTATPTTFGDGFEYVLDHSYKREWEVESGARGAFRIERAPLVEGTVLVATAEGYERQVVDLPQHEAADLRLVMRQPEPDTSTIRGIVVDRHGRAVSGARVSAGGVLARTDASGQFRVSDKMLSAQPWVRAVARGFQPASMQFEASSGRGEVPWPEFVALELGPRTLSIEGRVVEASGKPVSGVRVWLEDPTLLGFAGSDPIQIETVQVSEEPPFWSFVETNERGTFRIDGLADRTYRLRAISPDTLEAAATGPVQAGRSDIRILMEEQPEGFGGIVRTTGGAPAGNVGIYYEVITWEWDGHSTGVACESVTTGPDGRFEFPETRFDPAHGTIRVTGTGFERKYFRSQDLSLRNGELELSIHPQSIDADQVHFRVELSNPLQADSFAILDPDGRATKLVFTRANQHDQTDRMPLFEGKSRQLSTRSSGQTLVLYKGRIEVARHPIRFTDTDSIAVLRF